MSYMTKSYTSKSDTEMIQSGMGYREPPLGPSLREIKEFDNVTSCPSRSGAMEDDIYFLERFYQLTIDK